MMHSNSSRLLLLLLVSLLAGCGFHLRGSDALARHAPLYLEGIDRYNPLARRLQSALTASGIEVVESRQSAKAVLKIRDLGENQRVITVDSRGKATEYMLIRKVVVSLAAPDGNELVGEQEVGVRRSWVEVGKTGLAGRREAAELRVEMLEELSMSILRVLDYSLR
jgi:LPS-assembly lipoprotein